jgi:hypothetical protein
MTNFVLFFIFLPHNLCFVYMHVIDQFIGMYMVVTCGYSMIITQKDVREKWDFILQ